MDLEGLKKVPGGTDKNTFSCWCCQSLVRKSDLCFCDPYKPCGFFLMELYKIK